MDILNHYDIITYTRGNRDKYHNNLILRNCTIYYLNGKKHRDNDLPAIIFNNGTKLWYINGQVHRNNDKPAVIEAHGSQEWWVNGKRYKTSYKPAINIL